MNRRSLILDTTVRLMFDSAIVLSIYFLFAGHNQPGGGFVGGLVVSAAVALRYLAGGIDELKAALRIPASVMLSVGMMLAAGTALLPLAFGGTPLDQKSVEWKFEVLGKVKLTSATVFDAGVYLIVIGLILMIFEALGERNAPGTDAEVEP